MNVRRSAFRLALLGFAALAVLSGATRVAAQEDPSAYPARPIRVMIGFPPGGSTDGPMRVLADLVSKTLGQPVVIENKPGAGGVIPVMNLQAAAPDGYTLAVAPASVYRLPYTTDIKWNPATDLSYVIGLTGYAFGIVVPAASPIRTMADYVTYAKANPGMLTYSTPGVTTTNHLTMEQIARQYGVQFNHVPFKGSADSLQALLAGHVASAAETSAFVPYVMSGKLRLIAVWGRDRMARFPQVPTLQEQGIDIVQSSPWGVVAPRGTDPQIVSKLHDAFKQAMENPNFKNVLARYDMTPDYRSPQDFRRFAVEAMQREKDILETLDLARAQ